MGVCKGLNKIDGMEIVQQKNTFIRQKFISHFTGRRGSFKSENAQFRLIIVHQSVWWGWDMVLGVGVMGCVCGGRGGG